MKKVLSLLKPHRVTLIFSIIFATVNTVMQLLLPSYTKNIQESIVKGDMPGIWRFGAYMLGFTMIGIVTSVANTYFSTKTSVGYTVTLRNFIFGKVSHLSQSDIDKIGVSSLVTRTTNDISRVHDIVLSTLKSLVPVPIMLVGGLVMAFRTNPEVLKIALWIIPVLLVIVGALIAVIMPMYSKMQKLLDKVNQILREKISGIRVIRAFNRTRYEDERFAVTNKKLTGISLKANRIMAGLLPFLTVVMYSLICIVIYVSIIHVNDLDPTTDREEILAAIPKLNAFIAYFSLIISSFMSVISIIASIPQAMISGRRVNAIIDAVPEITEPEQPVTPEEEHRGEVEFRHVSFQYKPIPKEEKKKRGRKKKKEEPEQPEKPFELKDVSFVSRPGEMTAIIGITGSGKTTLMNLIPRLYDVTDGEILIAGVDVRQLASAEIEKRIAVIPQQAFLFSGTIADNVRYGNADATDAEVWRAIEIAQAKSFVAAMPEGIESFVSQAGKNYSGGQKQRLAIARAIVKGAEIMLFDDSFSALDLATDARLRASLKENLTDTNIIIVAQRVGTVINADRIIVLDNGEVVGQGTHKELLKTCDLYREIVVTQMSEEALADAEDDPKDAAAAPEGADGQPAGEEAETDA